MEVTTSAEALRRQRAALGGSATTRACARLTGEGQPVKVRREEGITNHFRPESCAGRCEAAGEALTGARTGRAIEHRKIRRLARRDSEPRRRQHRHHRHGEGMEGATVSKNPCTFVRPSSGPGMSSFCPGSRTGAAAGRRIPYPMMYGMKKSDEAIVPLKAANKGAQAPAESPEGRASTKGNLRDQSTHRTQGRDGVSQAVERIRQAATRKPREKLTALLHHITTDALRCAFFDLKKTASAGVDGMVWSEYEDGLDERLLALHDRVHSGAYRALPSRRVAIPKPDGGTRPLGIAALEDKIVQKAVVDVILTPLYEPDFLGFSYGFRPGRGAHDALDALAFGIERRKVNWIIDADIRAFFDRLSRDHLLRFLEHRIGDNRVLRLITKWLNAGVMEDGEWKDDLQGTPQGAVVSPILANVYLHYVLDLWFQKKWRARKATGDTIIVRYADDCAPRRRRREAEMAA